MPGARPRLRPPARRGRVSYENRQTCFRFKTFGLTPIPVTIAPSAPHRAAAVAHLRMERSRCGPTFGLAASWRRVAPSYFFSNFFVPRKGDDAGDFDLVFWAYRTGNREAPIVPAPVSIRRRPRLIQGQAETSECETGLRRLETSAPTAIVTDLKITVIGTVMDWNGIAQ